MYKWQFETMFPADLEEAKNRFPVAWLSLGPLEWHGEALAFGCDPALGYSISRQAWERIGGVLLPALYVGTGNNFADAGEAGGFAGRWERETVVDEPIFGSVFVRPVTLELVLRDYFFFLQRWGFQYCIVVSGHGAQVHMDSIHRVCRDYNAAFDRGDGTMRTYCWIPDASRIPEELLFPGAGDHADFSEASGLGGIDPSLVRTERFGKHPRDRRIGIVSENAQKIDFEGGKRSLAFMAQLLAEDIRKTLDEIGIRQP